MILIKQTTKHKAIFYSHLARKCDVCKQYIMPDEKFVRVQYSFIDYQNFHIKCIGENNGS